MPLNGHDRRPRRARAASKATAPGADVPALLVVGEATREVSDVLLSLRTAPGGLSRVEALRRRDRLGPNEVARDRPPPWYAQLLHSFGNPFILLLLPLA